MLYFFEDGDDGGGGGGCGGSGGGGSHGGGGGSDGGGGSGCGGSDGILLVTPKPFQLSFCTKHPSPNLGGAGTVALQSRLRHGVALMVIPHGWNRWLSTAQYSHF